MSIAFNPKKVLYFLILVFLILFLGNTFSIYLKYFTDLERYETVRKVTTMFNFDLEQNLPTLFSFCILLFSAILLNYLAIINKKDGKPFKNWLILAFVFYFLSVDEAVSIHELFIHPIRRLFGTSGFLYWAWVIPYGIGAIAFLIYNIKFLIKLPFSTTRNFVIAGTIFILGAVGLEMLGAHLFSINEGLTFPYALVATLEESFEMIGVIYFINSIFRHIGLCHKGLFARLYFVNEKPKVLQYK